MVLSCAGAPRQNFMKVSMLSKLLYLIVGVIAGIIASIFSNSAGCSRQPTIIRDTITTLRIDTIRIERPQPYKIVIRDTVEVNMPRNDDAQLPPSVGQWLYAETTYKCGQYTAVVEGIGAYLKSIEVYPRTELRTITTTMPVVKKTRWGVGVQMGAAFGKNGVQPYIGVGLSYNLICW